MNIKNVLILIIASAIITGCKRIDRELTEPGVSVELAEYRKKNISDLHYHLFFNVPSDEKEKVSGRVEIKFDLEDNNRPVILDFRAGKESILKVSANGSNTNYRFENGHIIIPSASLNIGNNIVSISFISADQALNRNPEYLYTLLVPDRASTAFPCFDQPDLKARFSLKLELPAQWEAVSNGIKKEVLSNESTKIISFFPGKPISTYLFAFAAGDFKVYHHSDKEIEMNIYHRETDEKLFKNNIDKIIKLHKESLQWMKGYTAIPYPYDKLDIVLVPAFQYSGMEHPGAIYYRDSRLLLEEGASLSEHLGRASLIAHEVSHMWFGNLVTMNWFSDVWLKEVFAGFMADKMVHPQYPEADHDLRFIASHHRRAMSVDRSQGTHPIRQELPNQKFAGTLYGAIIYNKAPVTFSQLERLMGEQQFEKAVREYLQVFAHDNASWDDLVAILNKHSNADIQKWSDAWIYGKGMPEISYNIKSRNNKIKEFKIISTDPDTESPFPAQLICYALIYSDDILYNDVLLETHETVLEILTGADVPDAVLLQGGGCGYGYFKPSDNSRSFLLKNIQYLDDYLRVAALINLHEDFLNANIKPPVYYDALLQFLKTETHPQIIPVLLDNIQTVYWGFLSNIDRQTYKDKSEMVLWQHLENNTSGQAQLYFKAFISMGLSENALEKMTDLRNESIEIKGLDLSESDKIDIVCELAVRGYKDINILIEKQLLDIKNPDRKRRFEFLLPALSHDLEVRDAFFESLKIKENRRHEPWVIDALQYLHHPLHTYKSLLYLPGSLAMIEEIQQTGDIFFPLNWLNATLNGHSSREARIIVESFINENPELSENLRLKILQAADMLFRKTN